MDTAAVDYDLPPEAIAQVPVEPRDAARLLIDEGPGRAPRHGHIPDLVGLVGPGDVVVVNTTRVLPARLAARRVHRRRGGGAAPRAARRRARALGGARAARAARCRPGTRLPVAATTSPSWSARTSARDGGSSTLRGAGRCRPPRRARAPRRDPPAALHHDGAGRPRALPDDLRRPARVGGGPHRRPAPHRSACSTPCAPPGAQVAPVELVVGLGTFRPIATDQVEDHHMHGERYRVPEATMAACRGRRRASWPSAPRRCGRSSRRPPPVRSTGPHRAVHPRRPAVRGRRRACSPTSTSPAPRCSCSSRPSSAPAGAPSTTRRWRAGYRFLSFGDAMFLRGERG